MRVLMVDDHVMFLQGLKTLLNLLAPELNLDTAFALGDALQMASTTPYELVLLDWHLGDGDGDEAMQRLREVGCAARVVVLSGETHSSLIRHTIDQGAAGFIPKTYSSELMLAALKVVVSGGIFLPPEALRDAGARRADRPAAAADSSLIDIESRYGSLTPRQADVYRAAARGLPNKLIARELGIAESTVKTHLSAVFAVLGVSNRTQAAFQASREGIRVG